MVDLVVQYRDARRGRIFFNPKQLLEEASILALVKYEASSPTGIKLATITYNEDDYTQQQILDAISETNPEVLTDGGVSFLKNRDDVLWTLIVENVNKGVVDPGGLWDFYTPKRWAQAVGFLLERMPPYYPTRSLTNEYEALSAAGKDAFEARYQVGTTNRWNTIYGLIVFIRTVYQEDPLDWGTWNLAHPANKQADLMETLETIYSWKS